MIVSAKNSGTSTDPDEVFQNEVIRVYEAYYNSKITTLFQNYFLYEYLTDTVNGDTVSLGDTAIAEAFITSYYYDKQTYSSESSYVSVMESTDGASLVMYYFDGVYYYFSVQHILLTFSDYVSNLIAEIEEYNSSSDYDSVVSDAYKAKRNEYAEDYSEAILATVSEANDFGSIALFGNYYYYDEDFSELYGSYYCTLDETTKTISIVESGTQDAISVEIYGGYIKLSSYTYNKTASGETEANTLSYTYNDLYNTFSTEAVLMATADDVISCLNNTYDYFCSLVSSYLSGDDDAKAELEEAHEDMQYIFEVALNMKNSGNSTTEIYNKVLSLLFIELEWVYSGDSLDNEVANKIGYIISSEEGNNGSWVSEFAVGSRDLLKALDTMATTYTNITKDGGSEYYTQLEAYLLGLNSYNDISSLTKSVISDYGIHIIKIENVYECGSSPVDIEAIISNYSGVIDYTNENFVSDVISALKNTYISGASNETFYDYIYEILYTSYVGSSSSSGTYFVAIEYEWLSNMYAEDKIEYLNKMSYDDLIDAIS